MRIRNRYLIFALVFILLSYMVILLGVDVMTYLANEDGFFENLGAASFLAASFILVTAFFRARRRFDRTSLQMIKLASYLALAFAMFFSAGEEVSWGQRLVGLDTPESIRAVNFQDEINVHNLDIFQLTPESNVLRWAWNIFWLIFAFGIPMVSYVTKSGRRWLDRRIPVIPLSLGTVFLLNYLVWRVIYMTTPVDVYLHFPEEIMECNLAVLFLVASIWIARESIPAGADGAFEGERSSSEE